MTIIRYDLDLRVPKTDDSTILVNPDNIGTPPWVMEAFFPISFTRGEKISVIDRIQQYLIEHDGTK